MRIFTCRSTFLYVIAKQDDAGPNVKVDGKSFSISDYSHSTLLTLEQKMCFSNMIQIGRYLILSVT